MNEAGRNASPSSEKGSPGAAMSFFEHLGELRKRLLISAIAFVVSGFAAFPFAPGLAAFMLKPASHIQFIYTAPAELFISYTRISIVLGLVVSLPILIYQAWAFINPALARTSRKGLFLALVAGAILFIIGATFAYVVVLPMTLRFFLSYSMPGVNALYSISEYFSFIVSLGVSFGAAFELPLVSAALGAMGLISASFLRKGRRYSVLVILIVAAILSPPDVLSQVLLSIPMFGLYELSIIVLAATEKGKRKTVIAKSAELA